MSGATATTRRIDVRNLARVLPGFGARGPQQAATRGVEDHTEHYVVNMLTMFSRSEALLRGRRRTDRDCCRWH